MKWLSAVEEVARLAGQKALSSFHQRLTVEKKEDGTPVTVADRDAEAAAWEYIARHFPDDGIVGEEGGAINPSARRQWIIDPIDGTKAFIRGVPLWGTLVAVMEGNEVLAGALYLPVMNDMLVAEKGAGCFRNGTRCFVSDVRELKDATALTTDSSRTLPGLRALFDSVGVARTWGDCYGYALVATGRAEAMVDPQLSLWDIAALKPIIEEAGGVFTDFSGNSGILGRSAVATNAHLADVVREKLRGVALPRPAFSIDAVNFEKGQGLVPVVTQDVVSGAVLMVAYADKEALQKTLDTGFMHYRSRTRGLWKKGETSGHVQQVQSLHLDCDLDTVLARVTSVGPACHTGEDSCFGPKMSDVMASLQTTLELRRKTPEAGSYTQTLFADKNKRIKKLGEETAELVLALAEKDVPKASEEVADVLYHALVALSAEGGSWADVQEALKRRQGTRRQTHSP